MEVTGEVEVKDGHVTGAARGIRVGHVFRRSDDKRVVQAGPGRLLFSWMQPYDSWERFLDEFYVWWNHFQRLARPEVLDTVSVRFINRIDVPQDAIEIKDYLRTAIDVSPYLPQILSGYYLQMAVPLNAPGVTTQIISTIVPTAPTQGTSLILDIESSDTRRLSLTDGDPGERLSASLDQLRTHKNYVFEACITDATRRLID